MLKVQFCVVIQQFEQIFVHHGQQTFERQTTSEQLSEMTALNTQSIK